MREIVAGDYANYKQIKIKLPNVFPTRFFLLLFLEITKIVTFIQCHAHSKVHFDFLYNKISEIKIMG